jgi:large subunit ribosomal protein L30
MAAKKKTKARTATKAAPGSGGKATAKTAKKAAAKKAAAKKAAAKKAPVKKATVRKTPVKAVATPKAETPEHSAAAPAAKSPGRGKSAGRIKVTLTKSVHGRLAAHQACAIGLGLRRRHQTVEVEDTPATRGMINRIRYMLEVEGQ